MLDVNAHLNSCILQGPLGHLEASLRGHTREFSTARRYRGTPRLSFYLPFDSQDGRSAVADFGVPLVGLMLRAHELFLLLGDGIRDGEEVRVHALQRQPMSL